MTRDPLVELLREADASLPRPAPAADLAQRAGRRVVQRRRRRRVLAAGGAVVVVLAGIYGGGWAGLYGGSSAGWWRSGMARPDVRPGGGAGQSAGVGRPDAVAAVDVAALEAELARLRQAAQLHVRLARCAAEGQRRADRMAEAAARAEAARTEARAFPNPAREARAEVDRAAETLVRLAERLRREEQPAAAARQYAEVARLFPESPWAVVAQQRLRTMPMEGQL